MAASAAPALAAGCARLHLGIRRPAPCTRANVRALPAQAGARCLQQILMGSASLVPCTCTEASEPCSWPRGSQCADLLLRARGAGAAEYDGDAFPAASLADAAAGSLAARGLAFANAHPAPRRWLPLRRPAAGAAWRGAAANAARLRAAAWGRCTHALRSAAVVKELCLAWWRGARCCAPAAAARAVRQLCCGLGQEPGRA